MEAKLTKEILKQIINLGAPICERIKQIYYPDKPWVECYKQVSTKFTQLKTIAKNFYTDKNEREILMELTKYSHDDIRDCFT